MKKYLMGGIAAVAICAASDRRRSELGLHRSEC